MLHETMIEKVEVVQVVEQEVLVDGVYNFLRFNDLETALKESSKYTEGHDRHMLKINSEMLGHLARLMVLDINPMYENSIEMYESIYKLRLYNSRKTPTGEEICAKSGFIGHVYYSDNGLKGKEHDVKSGVQYNFLNVDTNQYVVLLRKYWSTTDIVVDEVY